MNTERSRDEFEIWAEENLGLRNRRMSNNEYQSFGMYCAWESWQASRAALVIELPQADTNIDYHGYISRQEAAEAIESLGLKVKS